LCIVVTNIGSGLKTVPQLALVNYDWNTFVNRFSNTTNLRNDINLILLDSPVNLGLLDWNLKVHEGYICDDDITYLNSIMGAYMFNSEFLYKKSNMLAKA